MTNYPIPPERMTSIATNACTSTFQSSTAYEHPLTSGWNTNIINTILQSLISETSTQTSPPTYKFAVTSTIIQHLTAPRPSAQTQTQTEADSKGKGVEESENGVKDEAGVTDGMNRGTEGGEPVGRRGMHSASGAYWNNERDGMWSFKFDGGREGRGFDVVVSVIWVGV